MPVGHGSKRAPAAPPPVPPGEPAKPAEPQTDPAPQPVAPDPEGTPEERRALEAGIAKLAEQIKKEFGSEDTMDDLKLSDAERAVIQSIRAKQAAQAEAITTRETRTATAIKVLAMSNAEVTAMSSSERDHTISELAALLSDIGTE